MSLVIFLILCDMEGDGSKADCFAGEPAYALKCEKGVKVSRESFILRGS